MSGSINRQLSIIILKNTNLTSDTIKYIAFQLSSTLFQELDDFLVDVSMSKNAFQILLQ